jgi:hypothetical protein
MMAPDYAHWHGMYEVAERFYMQLIPQARELAKQAAENGNAAAAGHVNQVIDEILARPEHQWFERDRQPQVPRPAEVPKEGQVRDRRNAPGSAAS